MLLAVGMEASALLKMAEQKPRELAERWIKELLHATGAGLDDVAHSKLLTEYARARILFSAEAESSYSIDVLAFRRLTRGTTCR